MGVEFLGRNPPRLRESFKMLYPYLQARFFAAAVGKALDERHLSLYRIPFRNSKEDRASKGFTSGEFR
jgi:hypothetical protein